MGVLLLASGALGAFRKDGKMARCFEPRHVLRFAKGEREVAFVVCFRCTNARVVGPGSTASAIVSIEDSGGLKERLNGILRRRGIAIAP